MAATVLTVFDNRKWVEMVTAKEVFLGTTWVRHSPVLYKIVKGDHLFRSHFKADPVRWHLRLLESTFLGSGNLESLPEVKQTLLNTLKLGKLFNGTLTKSILSFIRNCDDLKDLREVKDVNAFSPQSLFRIWAELNETLLCDSNVVDALKLSVNDLRDEPIFSDSPQRRFYYFGWDLVFAVVNTGTSQCWIPTAPVLVGVDGEHFLSIYNRLTKKKSGKILELVSSMEEFTKNNANHVVHRTRALTRKVLEKSGEFVANGGVSSTVQRRKEITTALSTKNDSVLAEQCNQRAFRAARRTNDSVSSSCSPSVSSTSCVSQKSNRKRHLSTPRQLQQRDPASTDNFEFGSKYIRVSDVPADARSELRNKMSEQRAARFAARNNSMPPKEESSVPAEHTLANGVVDAGSSSSFLTRTNEAVDAESHHSNGLPLGNGSNNSTPSFFESGRKELLDVRQENTDNNALVTAANPDLTPASLQNTMQHDCPFGEVENEMAYKRRCVLAFIASHDTKGNFDHQETLNQIIKRPRLNEGASGSTENPPTVSTKKNSDVDVLLQSSVKTIMPPDYRNKRERNANGLQSVADWLNSNNFDLCSCGQPRKNPPRDYNAEPLTQQEFLDWHNYKDKKLCPYCDPLYQVCFNPTCCCPNNVRHAPPTSRCGLFAMKEFNDKQKKKIINPGIYKPIAVKKKVAYQFVELLTSDPEYKKFIKSHPFQFPENVTFFVDREHKKVKIKPFIPEFKAPPGELNNDTIAPYVITWCDFIKPNMPTRMLWMHLIVATNNRFFYQNEKGEGVEMICDLEGPFSGNLIANRRKTDYSYNSRSFDLGNIDWNFVIEIEKAATLTTYTASSDVTICSKFTHVKGYPNKFELFYGKDHDKLPEL